MPTIAVIGAALALWLVGGLRRYRRGEEWMVVYRLGRTAKERIVGPQGRADYPPYPVGQWMVYLTLPLLERVERVSGESMEAWKEVHEAVPFGVQIDRPARGEATGTWTVRAHGWDQDARSPYQLATEGSGHTEATALHRLAARLRVTVADGRSSATS